MGTTKACRECGVEQDVETGFRWRAGRVNVRMDSCRTCSNAGRKARRAAKLGRALHRAGQG